MREGRLSLTDLLVGACLMAGALLGTLYVVARVEWSPATKVSLPPRICSANRRIGQMFGLSPDGVDPYSEPLEPLSVEDILNDGKVYCCPSAMPINTTAATSNYVYDVYLTSGAKDKVYVARPLCR